MFFVLLILLSNLMDCTGEAKISLGFNLFHFSFTEFACFFFLWENISCKFLSADCTQFQLCEIKSFIHSYKHHLHPSPLPCLGKPVRVPPPPSHKKDLIASSSRRTSCNRGKLQRLNVIHSPNALTALRDARRHSHTLPLPAHEALQLPTASEQISPPPSPPGLHRGRRRFKVLRS